MARTDQHLVVDGSNIATEGRSFPSLAQLDEAVRAISAEYEYESLTVIVDATFAHRIDESERDELEAAMLAGELVAPPAGAIGRGDAFILQVASKAGAVVFSNDSFQEFHGEHDWLFEHGRLIGGKPIEGVGWIFVERAPVRGPTSRRSVREAEERSSGRRKSKAKTKSRKSSGTSKRASGPAPKPSSATPPPTAKKSVRQERQKKPPSTPSSTRASTKSTSSVEELNNARTFLRFVSSYSIGDEVEAVVEQFSSHGCYLRAASARCYLPSRAMGDPPPTRARDVVSQGQAVIVKVESLDSDRRGINVSLVRVIGGNAEEQGKAQQARANRTRRRNTANSPHDQVAVADGSGREGNPTRRTTNVATTKTAKRPAGKKAAGKRPAAKKTAGKPASTRGAAKKSAGKKAAATATSSARVQRAAAKKTAGKKTTARKSAAKKTTAKKTSSARSNSAGRKSTAKKASTKKAAGKKTTARKTTAKKTTAKKASTKKASPRKTTAKKTSSARSNTAGRKSTAKKSAAKKTTAKKASTKKATRR